MSSVLKRNFKPKILAFGRRFICSVITLETPSVFSDQHRQNCAISNQCCSLEEHSKSPNLTLSKTKTLHSRFLRAHILDKDYSAIKYLLDGYYKCSRMDYAVKLFDKMAIPYTFCWNLMISGCNKALLFSESWEYFCRMHVSAICMDRFTYGGVLSACEALQSVAFGEQVYGLVMKNGFFSNGYVRSGMIDLFVKSCRFDDALRVFYDFQCDNIICWNTIISGAVRNREYWVAIDKYIQMCTGSLMPNGVTISSVLKACAQVKEFEMGKMLHVWAIKCGCAKDDFVETALIDMYAKGGFMNEAVKEFIQKPIRNVVSWTAMINGFVQNDDYVSVFQLFDEMRKKAVDINSYNISSVLTACAKPVMTIEAMQIHSLIFKAGFYQDSLVKTSLINTYSKIGAGDLSEMVFAETEDLKHIGLWSNMISACSLGWNPSMAIHLFQRMFHEGLKPDEFCCSSVLGIVNCLYLGRQIHSYTLKFGLICDVIVSNCLFTMYSNCYSLLEAYRIFKLIECKDNVSWASMISAFTEHGYIDKSIQLFIEMLSEKIMPDEMTLSAVLAACSTLQSLKIGKEIHGFSLRCRIDESVIADSALVNMYTKCGDLVSARRLFLIMPYKDKFSCSSLIAGYTQNGYIGESFQVFHEMLMNFLHVDAFTISSILRSAAHLNRSGIGTQLHAQSIKWGLESDSSVGTSMVMMYSKCGSIDECCQAFKQIRNPDLVSWTAMIVSYAQHGKGVEALKVYELMRKCNIKPDSVTFSGLLSACSHSGLVEEGYFFLNSMKEDYGIEPNYRHYACMVDVLGRSGRLKEAERFIYQMPIKPDALVWTTLLAACKVHGEIQLGKLAGEKIMELEQCEAGTYVSLSNIWADLGQWEEVLKTRGAMRGTGVEKKPGWSYL
nr:pentatricopeptide repeat-containing protein At1g74600, chloroplastic [Ipomoea batatas]